MIQKSNSTDLKLSKYEMLYQTTMTGLTRQEDRFDELERKVSRYFSVLAIVLGLVGISLKEFIRIIKTNDTIFEYLFILFYFLLAISVALAVTGFIRSFKIERLKDLPMNDKLINHFQRYRYVDILFSLSKGNIKAIRVNKKNIRVKIRSAKFGYWSMVAALILMLITAILYIIASLT